MTIDLRHGDCLEILPTIPDASVDMVLTDLPYGTTQNKWDSEIPLEPLWREWRRVIRRGSAVVLFGQQPFTSKLGASNLPWLRYEWIYEKSHPTGFLNANRAPLKNHENILVFCEKGTPYNPQMSATRRMAHPGNAKRCVSYGEYDPSVPVRNPGLAFPRTILDYPEWNPSHPETGGAVRVPDQDLHRSGHDRSGLLHGLGYHGCGVRPHRQVLHRDRDGRHLLPTGIRTHQRCRGGGVGACQEPAHAHVVRG